MINKIVDGISIRINESLGDSYKIYTEDVKQGLEEPCFFIFCVNPINTQKLKNRYFRNNLFCIQYFPSSDEPKAECNSITDELFTTLEYIEVDTDLVRGSKMRGEFIDGVLNFFVNYDMFIYKVEDIPIMEELEKRDINVKGD